VGGEGKVHGGVNWLGGHLFMTIILFYIEV
jgi:hypothetical protein